MFSKGFHADGRRIHLARLVSFTGTAFSEFAIPLYLFERSGNPLHIGLQWTILALARIVAGYLAPRWNTFRHDRSALISLDLILAAAALLPVFLWSTHPVVGCYLATLITAFFGTLQGGYLDSLVGHTSSGEDNPETARAWLLGKIENGRYIGMFLGYGLAYLVSSSLGFRAAFLFDGASFLVSALLLTGFSKEGSRQSDRIVGAATPSYSVLARPELRVLSGAQAAAGFGFFIYNALYVVTLKREFGVSDLTFVALYVLQYFGYALGSRLPALWVELKGTPLSDRSTVRFRYAVIATYIAFALSPNAAVFIFANTVLSFLLGASSAGVASLFQRPVSVADLRAVGSARLAITSAFGAVGAAIASFSVQHVSIAWIFGLGAVVHFVSASLLAWHCRLELRRAQC